MVWVARNCTYVILSSGLLTASQQRKLGSEIKHTLYVYKISKILYFSFKKMLVVLNCVYLSFLTFPIKDRRLNKDIVIIDNKFDSTDEKFFIIFCPIIRFKNSELWCKIQDSIFFFLQTNHRKCNLPFKTFWTFNCRVSFIWRRSKIQPQHTCILGIILRSSSWTSFFL